jgi:hypothetical protein
MKSVQLHLASALLLHYLRLLVCEFAAQSLEKITGSIQGRHLSVYSSSSQLRSVFADTTSNDTSDAPVVTRSASKDSSSSGQPPDSNTYCSTHEEYDLMFEYVGRVRSLPGMTTDLLEALDAASHSENSLSWAEVRQHTSLHSIT